MKPRSLLSVSETPDRHTQASYRATEVELGGGVNSRSPTYHQKAAPPLRGHQLPLPFERRTEYGGYFPTSTELATPKGSEAISRWSRINVKRSDDKIRAHRKNVCKEIRKSESEDDEARIV